MCSNLFRVQGGFRWVARNHQLVAYHNYNNRCFFFKCQFWIQYVMYIIDPLGTWHFSPKIST